MVRLKATAVFTPSDFPQHTYVAQEQLEKRLREALETPGEVVSLSGPSKSGKTVLLEQVVGPDNLIAVTGAGLKNAAHLWERALDWMGVPNSTASTAGSQHSGTVSASAKGEVGLFGLGKTGVEGKGELSSGEQKSETATHARRGLQQIVEEIAGSDFVLLIDDYHYMAPEVQAEVAKEIKEAARRRVKICTASVPHRSDDVVRSNPELRGRLRSIDFGYWDKKTLEAIATLGFPKLNATLPGQAIADFAREASGSPQLMQAICLQGCLTLGIRESAEKPTELAVGSDELKQILEETSTRTDYSSLITNCHRGPKTRGTERKEFDFLDGSRGDVYRAVLLALRDNPPRLSFHYNELFARINRVCRAEPPQAASIYQACSQIATIARNMHPEERIVEWDENDSVLEIVDPYFLFYIRWSPKLSDLAGD